MMALDQALLLIREDICEWLNRLRLHDETLTPNLLIDSLKSGVLLHKLAAFITTAAAKSGHTMDTSNILDNNTSNSSSTRSSSFSPWLSRDRISRFLLWCRNIGLRNEILFESDGLLTGNDERTVIITLFKIAKFSAKFYFDVPELVRIEQELEENNEKLPLLQNITNSSLDNNTLQNIESRVMSTPNKSAKRLRNQTPRSHKRTKKQTTSSTSRIPILKKKERKSLQKTDALDDMAIPHLSSCSCVRSLQWERISSGHYKINGHSYFLRIFKNSIMVRIGGGWQTLPDFLIRKDPCRRVMPSKHK